MLENAVPNCQSTFRYNLVGQVRTRIPDIFGTQGSISLSSNYFLSETKIKENMMAGAGGEDLGADREGLGGP